MKKTFVTIISRWTDNFTYQVEVDQHADTCGTLEAAYVLTNRDNRPHGRSVCATSIGDLLLLNGEFWVVDEVGFKRLTAEQAASWQKVDPRDAHMGWEWCVENGVITAAGSRIADANATTEGANPVPLLQACKALLAEAESSEPSHPTEGCKCPCCLGRAAVREFENRC